MNRFISLASIVFIMFVCSSNSYISFAADETKLVSSAERLIQEWKTMISNGYYPVGKDAGSKMWRADKISYVKGSESYDIKRTDSIVTPYILIIRFKISTLGSNYLSPNANGVYSDYFKRTVGFKTSEEALKNLKETDFLDRDSFTNEYVKKKGSVGGVMCNYSFQNNNWVLKDGDTAFHAFFIVDMKEKENSKYFKNLVSFPIR